MERYTGNVVKSKNILWLYKMIFFKPSPRNLDPEDPCIRIRNTGPKTKMGQLRNTGWLSKALLLPYHPEQVVLDSSHAHLRTNISHLKTGYIRAEHLAKIQINRGKKYIFQPSRYRYLLSVRIQIRIEKEDPDQTLLDRCGQL